MPQLVKKRRSGWAVLAVGALVASILAVGAAPAAGQSLAPDPTHSPDVTPNWSACVGDAGSNDAGFSDVDVDNVHLGAINCIAYYGITLGKGDGTTFAPSEFVSAYQMRLFVKRTALLMGADGDAVLGKVELSDTVLRVEMAALMYHLLDDLLDWVQVNKRGNIEFDRDDDGIWELADDYFADVRDSETNFESQMVGAAYELGVVYGRSVDASTADSVFAPTEPVTRAQMASFITRALGHSNLRPEGLVLQRNRSSDTMITYRDADFVPIAGARVDVFSSLYPESAFDPDNGECTVYVVDQDPSHRKCEIDIGDDYTDDSGNIVDLALKSDDGYTVSCSTGGGEFEFKESVDAAAERTWAWSGALGDEVGVDTVLVNLEKVELPLTGAPADHAHISGGLPTNNELAKMGETVTFTVQMRTAANDSARPDRSGNPYHLRIERYYVERVIGTAFDAQDAALTDPQLGTADGEGDFRAVPGNWNYVKVDPVTETTTIVQPANRERIADARLQTPVDTLVWPNSNGEFKITLSTVDLNPAPADDNVDVGVQFKLTPFLSDNDRIDANLLDSISAGAHHADGNDPTTYFKEAKAYGVAMKADPDQTTVPAPDPDDLAAIGYVIFSDDAAVPYKLTAGSVRGVGSGSFGFVGEGNSLTVKVIDQYGDPMKGQNVLVVSDLDGTGDLTTRATQDSSNGVVIPGARDGDTADTSEGEDGVLYPEEMDITVQADEDRVRRNLSSYDGDGDGKDDTTADPNPGEEGDDTFTLAKNVPVLVTNIDGTNPSILMPSGTPLELAASSSYDGWDGTAGNTTAISQVVRSSLKTRSDGTRHIGYSHTGDTGKTETVTPYLLVYGDNPATTATEESYFVTGDAVKVRWVSNGSLRRSNGENRILAVDGATIVVNEGVPPANTTTDKPRAYYYDKHDNFVIEGMGATYAMFMEAIEKADAVEWRNYDLRKPGQLSRTLWEIGLSCKDPAS